MRTCGARHSAAGGAASGCSGRRDCVLRRIIGVMPHPSPTTRRPRSSSTVAARVAAALALAVLLIQAWFFAHVLWWNTHNPTSTAFMREQLERALGTPARFWLNLQAAHDLAIARQRERPRRSA